MQVASSNDSWSLTVVRTNGLFFLRPEKKWRPIITIDVDEHENYETILGCDGQNPNLKALFSFHQADTSSRVDFKVWHRSQSKRKGRKRNLVATARASLGELLKKQASETRVEIRLNCQSTHKRRGAQHGRPQNGALLLLVIRPPASLRSTFSPDDDSSSSETLLHDKTLGVPPSPASDSTVSSEHDGDDAWDIAEDRGPKKRRMRGYIINSDDDRSDCTSSSEDSDRPLLDGHKDWFDDSRCEEAPSGLGAWLMASVLPTYTESIEVRPPLWYGERLFALFTTYGQLRNATLDSHYEAVFARLQLEWTYIGGLLVALSAVDTAVFAITPGSLFTVDKYAQNAVAASSIASGLGIACDAWFLLRYTWADLQTFKTRARDVYGSYFFFALSARLPALGMLLSAGALAVCLGRVAHSAWPEAVVALCLLFGAAMSLQFLVYGAHWCAGRVLRGGRAVLRWLPLGRDAPPPPPPCARNDAQR